MSLYGIQIFGDDGLNNSKLPNAVVLDFFAPLPDYSGSKSYTLAAGETLHFATLIIDPIPWLWNPGVIRHSQVRVSGNTFSWVSDTISDGGIYQVLVYKRKSQ